VPRRRNRSATPGIRPARPGNRTRRHHFPSRRGLPASSQPGTASRARPITGGATGWLLTLLRYSARSCPGAATGRPTPVPVNRVRADQLDRLPRVPISSASRREQPQVSAARCVAPSVALAGAPDPAQQPKSVHMSYASSRSRAAKPRRPR
jgi:hypothetical protein